MDNINLNKVLKREFQETILKKSLIDFEKNKSNILLSRGFYVYGNPGVGKTTFVNNILKQLNYDIISYDASNIRNKSIIDMITKHNMSDTNILSLFNTKKRKIAIIMDEIDGLSNGDKASLSNLIKLIRPKKTNKQKKEDITYLPIICIGNYQNDKKIKELKKISTCIELKNPNENEIKHLFNLLMPKIDKKIVDDFSKTLKGDIRRIVSLLDIYNKDIDIINNNNELINYEKILNEDTKTITKYLLNNKINLKHHNILLNETDRTSIALLFHENIVDVLKVYDNNISIPFYLEVLDDYSYTDYIDRITFQNQIWIFNEISSLMKTVRNNNRLFENKDIRDKIKYNPSDVRFTKVLTKYSTEYNNQVFIQKLTNIMNMDKKDMLSYFNYLVKIYNDNELLKIFEGYDINKLDINRIIRFINTLNKEE
jgi:SpoVK/Ycf46/Vps4 family AAA+-type ATPase